MRAEREIDTDHHVEREQIKAERAITDLGDDEWSRGDRKGP